MPVSESESLGLANRAQMLQDLVLETLGLPTDTFWSASTAMSVDPGPLVSIITPVLNRQSMIGRCLVSVAKQRYPG